MTDRAPQTVADVKRLLAERGLRPRHRFGQNFLVDPSKVERLVDASGVATGDLVLEVGPGTGILTEALLARGARVVAAEIDRDLADLLEERLGAEDGFRLVRGDCLERGRAIAPALLEALGGAPFTLVANLPYGCASPLMAQLALHHPECRGQLVTVQKEVVDRLVAGAGDDAYGPLGIVVGTTCDAERIAVLPPGCFWPRPKVTSAMAAIRPRPEPRDPALADDAGRAAFARWIAEVFSRRRKQLGTILGRDATLPPGIDPSQRPETLSVDELVATWRATRAD